MNPVTFGDLIGQAREHLAEAGRLDGKLDSTSVLGAAEAMARIARTLSRYLADAAPFGVVETLVNPALADWARAAVDARQAMRTAAATLHRSTRSAEPELPAEGSGEAVPETAAPAVGHLRAASVALSAGRDLLQSHVGVGVDRERLDLSQWAPVAGSASVVEAILAETAGWSRDLAFLAGRLSLVSPAGAALPVPLRDGLASSCHWLLTASSALSAHSGDVSPAGMWLLESIPVRQVPARQPPADGESMADLVDGVARSADRLRVITRAWAGRSAWSPAMTADSWRWTASAAVVTCHISSQILGVLAAHPDLGTFLPGGGPLLADAGEQASRAWAAWRKVVPAWSLITTDTGGLTGPGVADVGDLALRLGRISFADPRWTPNRADRCALAGPWQVARDPVEFGAVIEALHHAADALACVAEADHAAVELAFRAGRLYQPTRTLPVRYDVPRKFSPLLASRGAALVGAYEDVVAAMSGTLAALDALAVAAQAPSQVQGAARAAARSPAVAVILPGGGGPRRTDGREPLHVPGRQEGGSQTPQSAPRGPLERTVYALRAGDPAILLRARAIDTAANHVLHEARTSAVPPRPTPPNTGRKVPSNIPG
jgi:hypothetical protein